jgi:DtxR family Mn-dependent transcriptional regulator
MVCHCFAGKIVSLYAVFSIYASFMNSIDFSAQSQAIQDYLKVIYKLTDNGNPASTNDIAHELKVAPASVTNMLKRLAEMNLVEYLAYKGVQLSESGRRIALEILRHHRLIELYLMQALGYPWDKIHDEAERLEHHISEEFEDRIAEFLGHPDYDPHGDPIPGKDGNLPPAFTDPLTSTPVGCSATIRRVADSDPELLRYCAAHKLVPGTRITIVEKSPVNQTINIMLENQIIVLGESAAKQIYITTD